MKMILKTDYAKAGINIFNGDIVKFKDEGKLVPSKDFKGNDTEVYKFTLELAPERQQFEGETKIYQMNKGTQRVLMEKWGEDSAKWVDRPLEAIVDKKIIDGNVRKVLSLIPAETDGKTKKEMDIPIIEEDEETANEELNQ